MSLSNTNTTKKDYTAISIKDSSVSYPPNSKIFCPLCSCNLFDVQKEEWYCNRCNVSYFPNKGEKVKRANRFETPGPLTDSHGNIIGDKRPLVAMVDNSAATNIRPKKPSITRSFEMIKRPGMNITSFSSTVDGEEI
jgi:hypothetical protein